jgi:Zn-dependent M28 family amino/carboxypeptidase
VEQHADELASLRLMINVDDIGSTRGKGFNAHGWDEAKPLLADLGEEMRQEIAFASRPNAYSDHFPFLIHGVPNLALGSVGGAPSGRGYGHTAADTFEKVSRADLRETAALLARSLLRFANEPAWALRHKSAAQIKRLLDRYEIRHVLRTEGNLPEALR